MRIQILSDLHLEAWGDTAPFGNPAISQPDVVVLAGDIHAGNQAVSWAAQHFAGIPVLYVHGNHEAYGKNLEDMQVDIARACEATENVHFLRGCSRSYCKQKEYCVNLGDEKSLPKRHQ